MATRKKTRRKKICPGFHWFRWVGRPSSRYTSPQVWVMAWQARGLSTGTYRMAGWPAVRFLVEELGVDVNTRDMNGFTPLHHAAGRGDTEMVLYLVERGADVMAVSRTGQTTADMANGPSIEVPPYPETRDLLVSLGAKNNNRCVQC